MHVLGIKKTETKGYMNQSVAETREVNMKGSWHTIPELIYVNATA